VKHSAHFRTFPLLKVTLFAAFIGDSIFILYGQSAPSCGTVLASYNSIPAYSNGSDQHYETDCDPAPSKHPPYGAYGEQFQCTEYVKRYYSQALGMPAAAHWIGDASEYGSALWATPKGLTFFPNIGPVPPNAGDILTFLDAESLPDGTQVGHVAIITNVSTSTVAFIEQNWSTSEGTTLPSLSYTSSCSSSVCTYSIADRYSYNNKGQIKAVFHVQGWLRATSSVDENPTPLIASMRPDDLLVGSSAQELTINGAGFLASSTVTFNGVAHNPTYVSASQLTISLTNADLATAGSYPVVATNPAPGGGRSAAVNFTVVANNPVPVISTLSPPSLEVGATPQTLKINGTGFQNSSTVTFNGIARVARFVDADQLTISLTSTDLATNGSYPVVVTNPSPGGGVSDPVNFAVTKGEIRNEWTWMNGPNISWQEGTYGTKGIAAEANVPSARISGANWADGDGNLWLFGGDGLGFPRALGFLNDLWEFDATNNTWAWISGSQAPSIGIYGTEGVPAATNVPGGRSGALSWIDNDGQLWLFGGDGSDDGSEITGGGLLNDLWKFDPESTEWTWMGGSSSVGSNGGRSGIYGAAGVPSPANIPGSRVSSVSWTDLEGNLWLFGGDGFDSIGNFGRLNDLWKFDPNNEEWTWMSGSSAMMGVSDSDPGPTGGIYFALATYGSKGVPTSSNLPGGRSDAVSWIDRSGNLWLFGGFGADSAQNLGSLNDLWVFSLTSYEWTWISGSSTLEVLVPGELTQPGIYGTKGIPAAANVPGGRQDSAAWIDKGGSLWLFGGNGFDMNGTFGNHLNDLWRFNPVSSEWTWMSGSDTLGANNSQPGIYGLKGVPNTADVPGGRWFAMSWVDDNDNLWLFGGDGTDSSGANGFLNDLWRYQP